MVEERSLAKGVLTLGRRVTDVVTQLLPTDEVGVGVDFVGLRGHKKSAKIIHGDRNVMTNNFGRVGKVLAGERGGWECALLGVYECCGAKDDSHGTTSDS